MECPPAEAFETDTVTLRNKYLQLRAAAGQCSLRDLMAVLCTCGERLQIGIMIIIMIITAAAAKPPFPHVKCTCGHLYVQWTYDLEIVLDCHVYTHICNAEHIVVN